MQTRLFLRLILVCLSLGLLQVIGIAQPMRPSQNEQHAVSERQFLRLCDSVAAQLNLPAKENPAPRKNPAFYIDSYIVRALAAAYDMTGKEAYLDACRTWSERMLTFQEKMIPHGFYYMNYARRPFETTGNCYNADNGCIAMGVLATAVRCKNPREKQRYLRSVKTYARLVLDNYIGLDGGIRNGLWDKFEGEWWCSSGTVGALFFLLHDETGDPVYLKAGLNVINWLNRQNLDTVGPMTLKEQGPSLPMYAFEAYSAGLAHIRKEPRLDSAAQQQIRWLEQWAASYHFKEDGLKEDGQWSSKYGGIPFHLLVQGRAVQHAGLLQLADRELDEIVSLIFDRDKPILSQFVAFSMLSMAEQLRPGAVHRHNEIPLLQ